MNATLSTVFKEAAELTLWRTPKSMPQTAHNSQYRKRCSSDVRVQEHSTEEESWAHTPCRFPRKVARKTIQPVRSGPFSDSISHTSWTDLRICQGRWNLAQFGSDSNQRGTGLSRKCENTDARALDFESSVSQQCKLGGRVNLATGTRSHECSRLEN